MTPNIAQELLEFYKTHEWCRNDWTRQIRGKTHYCMYAAVDIMYPIPADGLCARHELHDRLMKTSHHSILTTNDQMCRSKRDAIKWLEKAARVELT